MSTSASGATSRPGIHPGIVVGAIAVVVFGAAGAASYLGLLPGQAAQVPASPVGMATWRDHLFAWMNRNATRATDFFNIPINRVVELGTHVDI